MAEGAGRTQARIAAGAEPESRAQTSRLNRRFWSRGRWVFALGIGCLIIPTLISMARWSWSTDDGAHGPIVLATGIWLVWRDRTRLHDPQPQPFLPAGLAFAALLPLYTVGRVTSVLPLECASLYLILVFTAWLQFGSATVRHFWFPCVYFLFLIAPPENWMFVATRPLKAEITRLAVDALSSFGYSIGSTGSTIQIDGIQLLVATACSGINSLIGISAISLFYVYLQHGNAPRYAALLTVLLLPIALLANFLRIIILILITHYFGESIGQGIAHDATGMSMFIVALLMLVAIDALLYPLLVRRGPSA